MLDDQNTDQLDQPTEPTEDAGSTPANPVEPESAEEQAKVESEDVEESIQPVQDEKIESETPSDQTTQEPDDQTQVPSLVETQEQHDQRLAEEAEMLSETKSTDMPQAMEQTASDDPAKWYIVHTYSGHENKVAKSINQRVQSLGFENRIFDVIVPTRNTIKVSGGKKETVKEKIFPGYVLVKMILDDESWLLIRTTQGVTAFIGAGNKPTPISNKEVEAIQKFMSAEEPLYKASFSVGEAVKIVDGPFSDFLGTIDNIDEAKGKLKVLVSIFGRETPVELDFLQVNKL